MGIWHQRTRQLMKKTLAVLVGGLIVVFIVFIGFQCLEGITWSKPKPVLKMSAPEEWMVRYSTKDGPIVGTYFKPYGRFKFLLSLAFGTRINDSFPARHNLASGQLEWLQSDAWRSIPPETIVIDIRKDGVSGTAGPETVKKGVSHNP